MYSAQRRRLVDPIGQQVSLEVSMLQDRCPVFFLVFYNKPFRSESGYVIF